MGNCCSSQDGPKSDNFASPGRVLGSAPPRAENAKATIPAGAATAQQADSSRAGGHTLGGESNNDARSAAAKAAEERLNKNRGASTPAGDKLQAQLDAQKKQTMNDTLKQSAAESQAARDADAAAQARQWN